jgi:hypothetical protein
MVLVWPEYRLMAGRARRISVVREITVRVVQEVQVQ